MVEGMCSMTERLLSRAGVTKMKESTPTEKPRKNEDPAHGHGFSDGFVR